MLRSVLLLLCAALTACQGAGLPAQPPGAAAAHTRTAQSVETVDSAVAPAWQRVQLPLPSGDILLAHWWPSEQATAAVPQPAVVALHGCGGLYGKGGVLSRRYRDTVARLHAAGYGVLLPDSLGSRGVQKICSTRYGARPVNVAQRVQDARAALAWLAVQPGVDVQRMGVQGWSNGASTALHLLEARQSAPVKGDAPLAGVALFYPGCAPLLRRQAVLQSVPLLMQLGALDDWTPAQPCVELAQALQAPFDEKGRGNSDVTVHVYPGSYHGFDGTAPVRLRADVPNGTSPQGVHQGGNPQARAQALVALDAFWARVLGSQHRAVP